MTDGQNELNSLFIIGNGLTDQHVIQCCKLKEPQPLKKEEIKKIPLPKLSQHIIGRLSEEKRKDLLFPYPDKDAKLKDHFNEKPELVKNSGRINLPH